MKVGDDAGHGGIDSGTVSPKRPELNDELYTEESNIALKIAKRVQGILLACGHEVVMSRVDDTYVSLQDRSDLFNDERCDIAVSIHVNASIYNTAQYIATYIQGTGDKAEKLAWCIQPCLVKASGWPNGGVKVQNLHMTRETLMPACLVELGFLSNPEEELELNDPVIQGKLAAAICEGILAYAGSIEDWQRNLLIAATDTAFGQSEIKRAGDIWKSKYAARDYDGAEAAHAWANKVRQTMGLPTT